MGERAKKKRALEAKAARMAKKKAAAVDPASTDSDHDPVPASSNDKLPTKSGAKSSKSSATKQATLGQSIEAEGPMPVATTSSDNRLLTRSTAKNSNKKGVAPRVLPSLASSRQHRRSTRSLSVSSTAKSANLKDHTGNYIATRTQRVATAAAKALLQQLDVSDHNSEKEGDSTEFEEDRESDGGSNDDETDTIIELHDNLDEDRAISEPEGPGSGDSDSDGSDILATRTRKAVPKVKAPVASRGTQKKPNLKVQVEGEPSSGEFDDEFQVGEFF